MAVFVVTLGVPTQCHNVTVGKHKRFLKMGWKLIVKNKISINGQLIIFRGVYNVYYTNYITEIVVCTVIYWIIHIR